MIFSLLKISKKTGAALSSIAIAIGCLWGIAWWQKLSAADLLRLFAATTALILAVMLCALLLVAIFRLLSSWLRRNRDDSPDL